MPIYEYLCNACNHEFDALQKLSDAPLTDCPECGKPALKKKVSAPGFRLSGSGWYETDFKSDRQKNLAKSDSSDKADGGKAGKDSKAEKKAESKPSGSASGGSGHEAAA